MAQSTYELTTKVENNWLFNLSQINDHLNLKEVIDKTSDKQLKLYADNLEDEKAILKQMELNISLEEHFDGFYILTYEINPNTLMIDDASILMMDSDTLSLVEVESLRDLVVKYQPTISTDLLIEAKPAIRLVEFSAESVEYDVTFASEETSGEEKEFSFENTQPEEREAEK